MFTTIKTLLPVYKHFLTPSNIQEGWYYHKIDHYYENKHNGGPEWAPNIFDYIAQRLWQLTKYTYCELTDHKYVDHSTAGPDYGDIHLVCSRCDHTYHHTLY